MKAWTWPFLWDRLDGEVDRARALVTAARRSIRRVSCWSNDDQPNQPHSSRGTHGTPNVLISETGMDVRHHLDIL